MRALPTLPTLLALLVLVPQPAPAQDEKPKIRRRPDVITAAEISERSDLQTALDAVQRLRASWLRTRDIGSPNRAATQIVVYIDGVRAGDLEALRNLPTTMVTEMRKLNASDATTRYGIDHGSGAILVTTVRKAP